MKKTFAIILLLLASKFIFAQQQIIVLDSINFYGSLRTHVAIYDSNLEVQNNASRIGFKLDRRIFGEVSGFGGLELGTNLVRNNTTFNPDAATNPDQTFFEETNAAVTTRLGYIGLKTKYGSLSIGKQWGVYYDVTGWTDLFWVFGGVASGTYNTKTDGGTEGTGRAENALQYRYDGKRVSIGGQVQFNGLKQNYGVSAVVKITDQFSAGAAFNTYNPSDAILNIVGNQDDPANSFTVGAKYSGKKLYAALVYDYNQSESQFPGDTVVAFPANGIEAIVHYYIIPKLRLEGGVNYLKPTSTPEIIDPDFNILHIMIGGAYYFLPDFLAYTEYKIDAGKNTSGVKPSNVFTIGFRYNFSFGKSQVKL